ncbi:DUF3592 domain-containing protein [Pseudoalteromonas sp. APC 3358]|uniref:DUF3592 domain-containing protein n=1 Tax=Pseudoalteromonas sp. APC 3358 TaxID=3035176 RepID=UPI0025B471C9|nr:DUF3592 domain-containing protein [Pseudoalteromonas sp. APC 3358]MDN3385104.1 DUF3592 domain-containing protein [Pseudoalteromonas sp. APC 3358]
MTLETYAPIVIGLLMLLGGVKLVINASKKMKLSKVAKQSWPQTTGSILKSSYKRANFTSAHNKDKQANNYVLDFLYEYSVQGKKYTSTQPLLFGLYLIDDIQPFLSRYPVGLETKVYYDPQNPSIAVIDTGLYGKNGTHEIGFGGLLIITGLILFAIRYEAILQLIQ